MLTPGRRIWPLLSALVTLAVFTPTLAAQHASGQMSVHYLNVGQADAIYIECPEPEHHNMLIDAGEGTPMRYPGSPKLFQDQLLAIMGARRTIDVVISSHPHADHTGSMLWVLNTFTVGKFVDDGMVYDSATYKKLVARARELDGHGQLKFLQATDLPNKATDLDFCPATNLDAILVKPAHFGETDAPNNNSIIVRLTYDQQTFLFTGDAEEEEEKLLTDDPETKLLLAATVLKAGHHGSNTSSTKPFLDAVHPTQVVISAGLKDIGTNAGYKHPRAETVLDLLQYVTANGSQQVRTIDAYDTKTKRWITVDLHKGIYETAFDGAVVLLSDGQQTWNQADPAPGSISSAPTEEEVPLVYVYAKGSKIFHFPECADARRIKPQNRVESKTPPKNKTLHAGCPR